MKKINALSIAGIAIVFMFAFSADALGQANAGKGVLHFGGSFNQSFVDGADNGFVGGDIFVGKMFTNKLCVGFRSGYDIVSLQRYSNGFNKYLGVIPLQLRAKYYHSFSQMTQMYGSVGAGVFRTQAHLGGEAVGPIASSTNCPGISVSAGLDYWFLLTTGIGFELEYNLFLPPDANGDFEFGGEKYGYLSVRVNYCSIKF